MDFAVMKTLSRRTVLRQTSLMGVLAAPLPLVAKPSLSQAELGNTPARKLKVIVCGGHPGDPEYGCGGTVARYTDLGHEVVLLYLNRGEWPPNPDPVAGKSRMAEAKHACEILRAQPRDAGHLNGRAVVDAAHYESFRKIIESERPDVVFTQWPIDNHADHRAISILAYDSWLKLGKKFAFYYYEVSNGEDTVHFSPTHYVDITATESRKRQACYAHASQTPDKYYGLQEMVTKMRGVESGHRHAEGFIRHVQSPDFGLPMA
jgi:LmbE family N-acetylglucosaminyl deacetylase